MRGLARSLVGRLVGYFDHRFADVQRRLDVVENEVRVCQERLDALRRLVADGQEHAGLDAETVVALLDDLERAVRALAPAADAP